MRTETNPDKDGRIPTADDPTNPRTVQLTPCLTVVYPREISQCFKLGVAPRTIGSGQNADVVLKDDRIAPIHCRVSLVEGKALVEDLGSSAGTWIDNRPIRSANLVPGQVLKVGHYRFMLAAREVPPRAPDSALPQQPGADAVTGIPNRAWILRRADQVLEARRDSPRPVTLVVLAIDHLARVIQEHGFEASDRLLRAVAHTLRGGLREKDTIGLFSNEKFLLLLPETDRHSAAAQLGGLCRQVRGERFECGTEAPLSVTLSAGFATRNGNQVESLDQLLILADRALYRARRWGGDQAATLD